jgi:GntP family gluconate:H+ symporter
VTLWHCLLVFVPVTAGLIFLTTRLRVHSFITLLGAAIALGLGAGVNPVAVAQGVSQGFGKMLSSAGITIISGLIIGEFLDKTGGAAVISKSLMRYFGKNRMGLVSAVAGFLVGLPVMCGDTAFIILSPILSALSAQTGVSHVFLATTLAAGTYASYKVLPPCPGPLGVITMFGADLGRMLPLTFLMASAVMGTGVLWAGFRARRRAILQSSKDDRMEKGENQGVAGGETPAHEEHATGMSAGTALLPVALISVRSLVAGRLALDSSARVWLDFAGNPGIAMPCGVVLAMLMNRRSGMATLSNWTSAGIAKSASIVAIAGAAGALGSVAQLSGIGQILGESLVHARVPPVAIPFLLAAILKTAQGSSLMAMLTTPAIILPLLPRLGLSPEVASLSVIAGALAVVQVNDSFFWVVTKFANMDVSEGLKEITAMTLVQSVVAFAFVILVGLVA